MAVDFVVGKIFSKERVTGTGLVNEILRLKRAVTRGQVIEHYKLKVERWIHQTRDNMQNWGSRYSFKVTNPYQH